MWEEQSCVGQSSVMLEKAVFCGTQLSCNVGQSSLMWNRVVLSETEQSFVGQSSLMHDRSLLLDIAVQCWTEKSHVEQLSLM